MSPSLRRSGWIVAGLVAAVAIGAAATRSRWQPGVTHLLRGGGQHTRGTSNLGPGGAPGNGGPGSGASARGPSPPPVSSALAPLVGQPWAEMRRLAGEAVQLRDHDRAEAMLRYALESARGAGGSRSQVLASLADLARFYLGYHSDQAKAAKAFDEIVALAPEALRAAPAEAAKELAEVARAFRNHGDDRRFEDLIRRVVSVLEEVAGHSAPELEAPLGQLAFHLAHSDRAAEAEQLYRRALDIARQRYGPGDVRIAENMNELAALYRAQGRNEEATALLAEVAKELSESMRYAAGKGAPADQETNLGRTLAFAGDDANAEAHLLQGVAVAATTHGTDTDEVLGRLREIDRFYTERGRLEESLGVIEQIVGVREQDPTTTSGELGMSVLDLARRERQLGHEEAAAEHFQRALELFQRIPPSELQGDQQPWAGLIAAYSGLGDFGAAADAFVSSLRSRTNSPTPADAVASLYRQAQSFVASGDPGWGEDTFALALAVAERALPATDPTIAQGQLLLGDFYASQGRTREAESAYQAALNALAAARATGSTAYAEAEQKLATLRGHS